MLLNRHFDRKNDAFVRGTSLMKQQRLIAFLSVVLVAWGNLARVAQIGAQEAAAPAAPVAKDPVVRDLIDTRPSEPAAIVRIVSAVIDLREPAAALPLVKQLAGMDLDDAALAELYRQFGSGVFIKWADQPALRSAAGEFYSKLSDAVSRYGSDPDQIARRITDLQNPSSAVRNRAVEELVWGGNKAALALVDVLVDDSRQADHRNVVDALVAIGSPATWPVVSNLSVETAAARLRLVNTLARLPGPNARFLLLRPAFDAQEPEAAVRDAARRLAERSFGHALDAGQAAGLLYSRAAELYGQQPRSFEALSTARYLAADGLAVAADNARLRRIYLSATALGDEADATFKEAGVPALEDLLADALRRSDEPVAIAAARFLANNAEASILDRRAPQTSVLIDAARHANRRIRWAAVDAIGKLNPAAAYPGCSYVTEAVDYFLRSRGQPQALVAHPRSDEARTRLALLGGLGFDGEVALDHRQLLELATNMPDCELILIDGRLAGERSGQVISALRRDARTALIPVGILSSSDRFDDMTTLARRFPLTAALVDVLSPAAMQQGVASLQGLAAGSQLPAGERAAQGIAALQWVVGAGLANRAAYDSSRWQAPIIAALGSPSTANLASAAAAKMPSAIVQQALVDVASSSLRPIAVRQAALAAWTEHVASFGTLLTASQIRTQYDRYNASATADRETQKLLGNILDVIESQAALQRSRGPAVGRAAQPPSTAEPAAPPSP